MRQSDSVKVQSRGSGCGPLDSSWGIVIVLSSR
jgi:hypothetical protein